MKTATLEPKPKPGRPRYDRLEARVTPELKELLVDAATLRGVTLSDFIINSARDVAVQTVEEHKVIRLNREASIQFANALLRPPRPNARLKAAARRYLQATRPSKGNGQ